MRSSSTSLILSLTLTLISPVVAQESQTLEQLDKALSAAADYEHGANSDALRRIEDSVVAAAKDRSLRGPAEEKLLKALETSKSRDARSFICRQLRTIGTAKSVPVLETLLTDPELAHMARYALGRMEVPAAGQALLRALDKTTGNLKIGVINALGDRKEKGADSKLIHYLSSSSTDLAVAAANALGKIGGTTAAQTLSAARKNASGKRLRQIDNALISCADKFLAQGQEADAIDIYKTYYDTAHPRHLRIAALRGLLAADNSDATVLLKKAMESPELRASAIGFARDVKGKNATRILTDLMPSLPADAQELLLGALSERGDASARSAALKAVKSDHENVRLAAITALGSLGNADTVMLLLETAAGQSGSEQRAARDSLVQLQDRNVNSVLTRTLSSNKPNQQTEAIRALSQRKATSAVTSLLTLTSDSDANVRHTAITAVGALASEEQLPALLNLNLTLKNADDLDTVQQATESAFRRVQDTETKSKLVIATLDKAKPSAQPNLIRLLSKTATARGLKTVRAALKNDNAAIRDAAIRALSEWPDPTPAEDLLKLVTSAEGTQRILALRGYVRMAGLSRNPTAMYIRAMDLADRIDDKKLVLGGLGSASSPEALKIAQQHLKNEELQSEAGLATVQIAGRLRQSDARAALQSVTALVKDSRIRKQAQNILNEMDQYEGYILTWLAAGPYQEKGKDGQAIFNMTLPPEKPNAPDVTWKPISKGIGPWSIDLEQAFRGDDHIAAYLKTRVWSPKDQAGVLELGSDDSIKAWLNGKLVHSKWTIRGLSPRQDIVKVNLSKGWNNIMLKVGDYEGGWAFCCRVRKPDGTALGNLRFAIE